MPDQLLNRLQYKINYDSDISVWSDRLVEQNIVSQETEYDGGVKSKKGWI